MGETIVYPRQSGRRIRYRRDLRNSYMIIEGDFEEDECEKQMLQENRLSSLLSFSAVSIEEHTQFWYDITGCRSLGDLLQAEGLTAQTLVWLFGCMLKAEEELALCLISAAHVPLDPEVIFADGKQPAGKLLLCYCPEPEEGSVRFLPVLDLIITCADESDRDMYDFCFELHSYTVKQNPSAAELLEKCKERFPEAGRTLVARDGSERRPLSLTSDTPQSIREAAAFPVPLSAAAVPAQPSAAAPLSAHPAAEPDAMDRAELFDTLFREEESPGFFAEWRMRFAEWLKGLRPKPQKAAAVPFALVPDTVGFSDGQTTLLMETPSVCRGFFSYEGTGNEPDFSVRKEEFHIGSSTQGNDAVLTARTVSRHHARILYKNGRYYLEDLNSRNGTRVNGQLLEYHQSIALSRGDRILFASERYRVD